DARVVVDGVGDEPGLRVRRHDDEGHAYAVEIEGARLGVPFLVDRSLVVRDARLWRRNVVVETAMLVVREEERSVGPLWALEERVRDIAHELLSDLELRRRVLVVAVRLS